MVVVVAGSQKCGLHSECRPINCDREAQHVAVECRRPVEVGNPQMHMADTCRRGNYRSVHDYAPYSYVSAQLTKQSIAEGWLQIGYIRIANCKLQIEQLNIQFAIYNLVWSASSIACSRGRARPAAQAPSSAPSSNPARSIASWRSYST